MSSKNFKNDDQFFEMLSVGSVGFGIIVFIISILKFNPELIFILISGFTVASYIKYLLKFKGTFQSGSLIILSMFLIAIWSIFWFYREAFLKIGSSSNKINKIFVNIHENYSNQVDINWYTGAILLGAGIYALFYYFIMRSDEAKTGSIYDVFCRAWNLEWKKKPLASSIYIGEDKFNKNPIYLPEIDMARHVQIMGGTGAGKTNLLKNIIEPLIARDESVIFLDMKAEKEMITWLENTHKLYKKEDKFSYISTNFPDESIAINPIKKEDLSDIVPMIMESLIWSESYYEDRSRQALNHAISYFEMLQEKGKKFICLNDLICILSDQKYFDELESEFKIFEINKEGKEAFCDFLYSSHFQKDITKLIAGLDALQKSKLGKRLCNVDSNARSLSEVVENGGLVYVQLNAMKDQISSSLAGKILLQDLINTVGEKNAHGKQFSNKKCTLIIDEFSDFATPNFIKLLNKCRSAGMGIIIAYQSSGDLEHISPIFGKRISANCGIKFFFGTNDPEDSEEMSKMVGTQKSTKTTQKILEDIVQEVGSIRDVEEFLIHPNEVKNMEIGEVLMLNKWGEQKYALLKAPLSREYVKYQQSGVTKEEFWDMHQEDFRKTLGIWKPSFPKDGYYKHEDFYYDPSYQEESYTGNFYKE